MSRRKRIKVQAVLVLLLFTTIPVLILSLTVNSAFESFYNDKIEYQVKQNIENLSLYIASELQLIIDQSAFFANSYVIKTAINHPAYTDEEKQLKFKKIYDEIFMNKNLMNNSIFNYIIYTKNKEVYTQYTYSPNGGYEELFEKASQKNWFIRLFNTYSNTMLLFMDDNMLNSKGLKQIYVTCNITDDFDTVGILQVGIAQRYIAILLNNAKLTQNGSTFIIDNTGSCILSGTENAISFNTLNGIIDSKQNEKTQEIMIDNERYISTTTDIALRGMDIGWEIVTLTPEKELYTELTSTNLVIVLLLSVFIVLIIIMIFLINRMIVNPILKINHVMNEFADGNMNIYVEKLPRNEIGEMGGAFNKVILSVKKYIKEIKQREIQKRELEIEMLQSQIKPHFIKNTISTIRWMADIQGLNAISKIAISLCKLIDYNLKNADMFASVEQEVSYLEEYLYLQKLYLNNKFDYKIDVDKDIMTCNILKLSLQPIIENSILHGLLKKKDMGYLSIKIFQKEGALVVEIFDNGLGINSDKLAELCDELKKGNANQKSIGLSNVNQRIQLNFGKDYGIILASQEGKYTKVTLIFPLLLDKEYPERI